LIGAFTNPDNGETISSRLLSSTSVAGKAGDITVTTRRLLIQDGGEVATDSLVRRFNGQFIPGVGAGGNITVDATESIELVGSAERNRNVTSGLFASTSTPGNAGKVTITTGKLIIRDRAEISVISQKSPLLSNPYKLGNAGEINVTANSIVLDGKGRLTSNSDAGRGGNINLQVRDLLLMRRGSLISANAGTLQTPGDGGNINVNAPKGFIVGVPLENNDITANAFADTGGRVTIEAKSIFGFVPRSRAELVRLLGEDPNKLNPNNLPTNDITAISQLNPSLSGTVEIKTPDVDASQGIVELPTTPVDVSQQITSACSPGKNAVRSSLIASGRGGISPTPMDTLTDDAVLTDWIQLPVNRENHSAKIQPHTEQDTVSGKLGDRSDQIIEAQGWVVAPNGNVVLVAQAPTVTPHSVALQSAVCGVH
jgi:large exoprotein involved in heme utilization and adhesion